LKLNLGLKKRKARNREIYVGDDTLNLINPLSVLFHFENVLNYF